LVDGLVLGSKDGLADNFRAHVQGGAGSFRGPSRHLSDAMIETLRRDLAATRHPVPFT
jgi:hypothetical protein